MEDNRWKQKPVEDIIRDIAEVKEEISNVRIMMHSKEHLIEAGFIPEKHEYSFVKECVKCCFATVKMCGSIPCSSEYYTVNDLAEAVEKLNTIEAVVETHS